MAVLTRGLAALREVEQTEIWPWCQLIWDWSFLSVLFPMLSIDLVLDTGSLIPLSISFSIKLSANEFDYVLESWRDSRTSVMNVSACENTCVLLRVFFGASRVP